MIAFSSLAGSVLSTILSNISAWMYDEKDRKAPFLFSFYEMLGCAILTLIFGITGMIKEYDVDEEEEMKKNREQEI